MPLPPTLTLRPWFLEWLDEDHPECESGVDLLVALFEDLGDLLDEHQATDDEYERIIAVCLELLLLGGDFWTPQNRQDILSACEERLGVTITHTN